MAIFRTRDDAGLSCNERSLMLSQRLRDTHTQTAAIMSTLLLLRHAKSSWDDPSLGDFDRPLARRGLKAAPAMGRYLRGRGLTPDLVLCSPAVRAKQTLELVLAELDGAPEVRLVDTLYSASAPELRRAIRGQAGDVPVLMLVGHNPALESLARALVRHGDREAIARMHRKFPAGAVAVIEFDFAYWRDIEPGTGRLREFVVPKELTK